MKLEVARKQVDHLSPTDIVPQQPRDFISLAYGTTFALRKRAGTDAKPSTAL